MTPREEAVKEIKELLLDVLDHVPLVPTMIKKQIIKSGRIDTVASRIIDISEKYVDARIHWNNMSPYYRSQPIPYQEKDKPSPYTIRCSNNTKYDKVEHCGICSCEIYPSYLCKCNEWNLR